MSESFFERVSEMAEACLVCKKSKSYCLSRQPKYHLRTSGFTVFTHQVGDLHGDLAFELSV